MCFLWFWGDEVGHRVVDTTDSRGADVPSHVNINTNEKPKGSLLDIKVQLPKPCTR